jgi:hypothetical protein
MSLDIWMFYFNVHEHGEFDTHDIVAADAKYWSSVQYIWGEFILRFLETTTTWAKKPLPASFQVIERTIVLLTAEAHNTAEDVGWWKEDGMRHRRERLHRFSTHQDAPSEGVLCQDDS